MALLYTRIGDVGPALAPASPSKLAAQAAGMAAARAAAAASPSARLSTVVGGTAAGLSTPAKLAIGGGLAALLILVATRRG